MISYLFRLQFALAFLISILTLSCGQNQIEKQISKSDSNSIDTGTISRLTSETELTRQVAPVENISSTNGKIIINTFTEFPSEIDGCACYYSANESKFKSGIYIYADDYGDNAFVSINDTMRKFTLNKTDTLSGNRTIKTFANDHYQITIDEKQVGQIDETWQQSGTMKIKSSTNDEMEINIYGECGC